MSGAQARCERPGAKRLCALGFLAVVTSALAILSQAGQADDPPFTPHVAVAMKGKDRLKIAVSLNSTEARKLSGTLRAALLDADGRLLQRGEKELRPADAPTSYGFDFPVAGDVRKLTLRLEFGRQRRDFPIGDVLLAKGHETILNSGREFFTASQASLHCEIHGVRSLTETVPLPGSEVVISLRDSTGKVRELSRGRTGDQGLADVAFQVPAVEAGNYTLVVATRSPLGEDKLEQPIRLKADPKILLVSDKPIYQPGQIMHMRALALQSFDLKPVANQDLLFEVEDSKGNKVFKKTMRTSEFGVAAVDFQLADEVNMGDYHLRAALANHRTEKTVTVRRYVLPKFKVAATADKSFYLPREKVHVTLQSDYFFGKPVSAAKIEVTASTFDIQFRTFQTWTGRTDAQGAAKFTIQLPDYFVGQPLQQGNALVKLDIKVTDTADHAESVTRTYSVSDRSIRASVIPEGGRLTPNMDNRVFVAAMYPDGSPAADCKVMVWAGRESKGVPLATIKANAAGLAEFHFTPRENQFRPGQWSQQNVEMLGGTQIQWAPKLAFDMRIVATDARGNRAESTAELNGQPIGDNLLVRLNQAIYRAGDRLDIDIHTSAALPTVFLDIVRGGQILLSKWLAVEKGRAQYRMDVPDNLFGSLEVHAYQMLRSGEIIRDSRVIYVHPRNDLKVTVQADQPEYLPGATGRIRFQVTDSAGRPTAAALGVIVVDEAVYALQDLQPGLEKLYFTLQEELLKPQVQIKFSRDNINNLVRAPALPQAKQQIAEVLLTSVKLPPPPQWQVNPALDRRRQFSGMLQNIGFGLFNYANSHDDYIRFNKAKQQWEFTPDLLDRAVKARVLAVQSLQDPLGGTATLSGLMKMERNFAPDNLARSITLMRMNQLFWVFAGYANSKKNEFSKEGRWTFPESILADAVAQQRQDRRLLRDGWGTPIQLVESEKKLRNPRGQPPFDYHQLVSAGPDRKFGTEDDIASSRTNFDFHWSGQWWWLSENERRTMMTNLGRRRGMAPMFRFEAAGRAGGMPMADMPLGAPKMANMVADKARHQAGAEGGGQAAMRIREFFPETMLWQPALITDDQGIADLAVNFADSITTWRLSASASSLTGSLGGVQVPLKVFQEFFVDIDLPVSLTQSDEIAFPVAVYNYLKTPQTLKLELQEEPWFELLDKGGSTRRLELKPNEVTSAKFRIKARKIGLQPLTVKAFGSKKSDAVKRLVEVVPNGQKIEKVITDKLQGPDGKGGTIAHEITIPENAVPEASRLIVRLYPGVMAQVLEGVDGLIRLPGG
jgi:alpha-2-macroglobulin family protein/MG2 domain-containing protein/macroglobulin-like protein